MKELGSKCVFEIFAPLAPASKLEYAVSRKPPQSSLAPKRAESGQKYGQKALLRAVSAKEEKKKRKEKRLKELQRWRQKYVQKARSGNDLGTASLLRSRRSKAMLILR